MSLGLMTSSGAVWNLWIEGFFLIMRSPRSVSAQLSAQGGCATSRCDDWGAGAGIAPRLENLVLLSWIREIYIPRSPEAWT
eukprot:1319241-Amphidinium_carterae.1